MIKRLLRRIVPEAIDIVYSPQYSDQEFTSSVVTFSKKPFEQILSIPIIAQPIPQSLPLLTH